MKCAIGYTRVSTQAQVENGNSLEMQRKKIETQCKLNDLKLVNIFTDEGISGASKDGRLGLKAALDKAAEGEIDYFIVWKLDRFGRKTEDVLNSVTFLTDNGVEFVSIADHIDTGGHMGKFLLTVLSAVAEMEAAVISERTQGVRAALWQKKKRFIGQLPYGYCFDGEEDGQINAKGKSEKNIRHHPKEKEIYLKIVNLYLDLGLGTKAVADELGKLGYVGRKGKPFTGVTVAEKLRHPAPAGRFYTGQYVYEKEKKTKKMKPESEWIAWEVEPLITKSRWRAIQDRLDHNKTKSKRAGWSQDFWLRDKLVCAECGGRIKPYSNAYHDRKTPARLYCCYWKQTNKKELERKGRERCRLPYLNQDKLERSLWSNFVQRLAYGGCTDANFMKTFFDTNNLQEQIDEIKTALKIAIKRIEDVNRKINKYENEFESDELPAEYFRDKIRELRDEKANATKRKDTLDEELARATGAMEQEKHLREFLSDNNSLMRRFARELNALDHKDKKRMIECMVDGPIKVCEEYDDYHDEYLWKVMPFRITVNTSLLTEMMKEQKLRSLEKLEQADYGAPGR